MRVFESDTLIAVNQAIDQPPIFRVDPGVSHVEILKSSTDERVINARDSSVVAALSALPAFAMGVTWQEATQGDSIDFAINAPSHDYGWILTTYDYGSTITLLSKGAVVFPDGLTPDTYDTPSFSLGAPGAGARQIAVILFRYGDNSFDEPDLLHPDAVSFNYVTNQSFPGAGFSTTGDLAFWVSFGDISDPGTVAPLTISFNEVTTVGVGWMVFAIDDGTWVDYDGSFGTGDGTMTGAEMGSSDPPLGVIGVVADAPGTGIVFSPTPWDQRTAVVYGRSS
jgi:hypothetical protein